VHQVGFSLQDYVEMHGQQNIKILEGPKIYEYNICVFSRDSGRNYEQIEVRECLLLFDTESFVFQFAIQKVKDQDI